MNTTTRIGYCCINLTLESLDIKTSRGMVRKTFNKQGLPYCGELALKNINDLIRVLRWNVRNNVGVYRITSSLFPWMSEYELTDLPNFAAIHSALLVAGDIVKESGMRVSMHPGQFNILCSPDPALIAKTVKELDQHAQIFDCMGLAVDHNYPINIHIGATYGDKEAAADRFCQNFKLLSHSTQSRLVVENDDKSTQYSVRDLYDLIWIRICTPITFDYHHHRFNDGGLSEQDALGLAGDTWYCRQLVHYSSCKKTFEDPGVIARSHADYIYERINDYGHSLDIELEAKAKDLALIRYLANIDTLLENYLPFDDKRVFEKVE